MDLGPLNFVLTWQTVLLAAIVSACTSGVKAGIDYAVGGTSVRKANRLITELVLPAVNIVLGVLAGALIPLYPDELVAYSQAHAVNLHVVGAAYGFFVGLFSDWLYQRFHARLKALGA